MVDRGHEEDPLAHAVADDEIDRGVAAFLRAASELRAELVATLHDGATAFRILRAAALAFPGSAVVHAAMAQVVWFFDRPGRAPRGTSARSPASARRPSPTTTRAAPAPGGRRAAPRSPRHRCPWATWVGAGRRRRPRPRDSKRPARHCSAESAWTHERASPGPRGPDRAFSSPGACEHPFQPRHPLPRPRDARETPRRDVDRDRCHPPRR